MLCLKCGKKETLQYSEKCEGCENKDLRFYWLGFGFLLLFALYTGFVFINLINVIISVVNFHLYAALPIFIFEVISKFIVLILAGYTLFLYLKYKKKMINTCIILLTVNFIFCLIDPAIVYFVSEGQLSAWDFGDLGKTLINSVLLGAYFLSSERVERAFVH